MIVVFLIWCVLSILWSADPLITVRRLMVLSFLCVAAWGL